MVLYEKRYKAVFYFDSYDEAFPCIKLFKIKYIYKVLNIQLIGREAANKNPDLCRTLNLMFYQDNSMCLCSVLSKSWLVV